MTSNQRSSIYDGTDIVAKCRLSYNLDYWNGHFNCNPERGKHKTITKLPDDRYAIIWSDEELKKNIGKVVTDEFALIEVIKAKKFNLLNGDRFIRLKKLYMKNPKKYDNMIVGRKNKKKKEELVIITKDGFLVAIYSNNSRLQVKNILDIKEPPRNYYKIWGIEDGIQEHRKLSNISREYRENNK